MWVALKRAGCYVVAFGGYVNCLLPHNFSTFNTMLCLAFFQEIRLSTSLLCTSLYSNFLSESCPSRWIPCSLLTNTAVTSFWCHKLITIVKNSKYVKEQWQWKFYSQSVWRNTPYFKHWKYQNLFTFSSISAECLQKWLFITQGSVVTYLRWDEYCRMCFVANFIRIPVVQKFWKSVKIWQSYREFKGRNFFETQCIMFSLTL